MNEITVKVAPKAENSLSYVPFTREGQKSGFDMKDTLNWYRSNREFLLQKLSVTKPSKPSPMPFIENAEYLGDSVTNIERALRLFPEQAQKRSIITNITGEPSQWFHRDSTAETPLPTDISEDAYSKTAIIPGSTTYQRNDAGNLEAELHVNKLSLDGPHSTENTELAQLIHTEAVVHEATHPLIAKLLYTREGEEIYLRLPTGYIIEGKRFLMEVFKPLAEKYSPISNYSSAYRDVDNMFIGDAKTAVGEELAELVATRLLGYASGSFTDLSTDPFKDRLDLRICVDDFLRAEELSTTDVEKLRAGVVEEPHHVLKMTALRKQLLS